MKKYLKYFLYLLIHKKNVFIICMKKGMFVHAFMHDMSKFSRIEFMSYVKHFYGNPEERKNSGFEYGWLNHIRKNKHHWNYWVHLDGTPLIMPLTYVEQMICDWEAMGIVFEDTALNYYEKNKSKITLHPETRSLLENLLRI